ncbi:hypothetical protein [Shinella sp.]|uniref:capsular polysaccharide export protein, LipB/KpsS family n=1 Tax=Shinella sp. TaxID=1870904 RepID=UPI0039E5D521
MRLLCVSTAKNTDHILRKLKEVAGPEIEATLHFGREEADYRVSSFTRMKRTTGTRGHILDKARYTGAAKALIESEEFSENLEMFVDHLHRRSALNEFRSHPIRLMHDYFDYYHLLADTIAKIMSDERIDHVLFFNVPHLAYDTIIYQIARSLGIKITIVSQSLFPGRFFSLRDMTTLGLLPKETIAAEPYKIERGKPLDLFYMKGVGQERGQMGGLTASGFLNLMLGLFRRRPLQALNPFAVAGWLRRMRKVGRALPKWRDPFSRYFHPDHFDYYENLLRYEENPIDLDGPFVYFPLQMQPEMTTSSLGGKFRDQALAIERLADLLPENVRILVKENPKQGAYMRGPLFYHRLARIPNVTILPSYANTHALMQRSQFVATITGTVGWEAIRAGKPALVFGAAWYRSLPGVVRYRDDLTYEEIVGLPIDHAALEATVGQLLARAHEGVVDRHYTKLVPGFDADANADCVAKTLLALMQGEVQETFSL